jgi:tight adherence protein B
VKLRFGRLSTLGLTLVAMSSFATALAATPAATPSSAPTPTQSTPAGISTPSGSLTLTVEQPDKPGGDLLLVIGVPREFDRAADPDAPFTVTVTQDGVVVPVTADRRTSALSVALVVDTSGSMRGESIRAAKAAADQFLAALPADAEVSVSSFGATVSTASPFTADRAEAKRQIARFTARGETALRDAIVQAIGSLSGRTGRRALIVLSDGADTVSKASTDVAFKTVKDSGIAVHAVVLQNAVAAADAGGVDPSAELSSLTAVSNGSLITSASPDKLDEAFNTIAGVVGSPVVAALPASIDPGRLMEVVVTRTFASGEQVWNASIGEPIVAVAPSSAAEALPPASGKVAPQPTITVVPKERSANAGRWLVLGAGAIFASMLTAGWLLVMRQPKRHLAAEYGVERPSILTSVSGGIESGAERLVRRHDRGNRLRALLQGTGWSIQPGSFLAAVALFTIAVSLLMLGFAGFLLAVIAVCAVPLMTYLIVRTVSDRRCKQFQEQFEGTLQLMANSLRAGYGVNQAMDTIARESAAPTSVEFYRALQEARLGQDLIVALREMAGRVRSNDLEWVIDAIEVNRDVGGNLSELFASVADTVRARGRLARQVKALSAEGRLSALILAVLPFIVFGLLSVINPEYVKTLAEPGIGRWLIVATLTLMSIGVVWLKKVIRIEL